MPRQWHNPALAALYKPVGRWTVYRSEKPDAERPFLLTTLRPIPNAVLAEIDAFITENIHGPVQQHFHGSTPANAKGLTVGFANEQDRMLFLLRWSDL